jgi:hypothetical protein
MAKNRMHQVSTKPKKNKNHCGTITVEDQLRMARAGRRDAEIASGHNRAAGTGIHGGDKDARKRKDRRQSKADLRKESY